LEKALSGYMTWNNRKNNDAERKKESAKYLVKIP
jgi:hypothetical protein